MTKNRPAEVFAPGEFIREEIEARGWTQGDLASIMGRPIQLVNGVVTGKRAITAQTAQELAEAFGTSAELWLNLQSAYSLSQQSASGDIARRARLYEGVPVKAMQARGWIKKTKNFGQLLAETTRFYGCDVLESAPALPMAARSSRASAPEAAIERIAWGFRAMKLARSLGKPADFSARTAQSRLGNLRRLASCPEGVRLVPRTLASMGIRFLVLRHLPKSRMDGASLSMPDGSPLIAMSLRYDRIDNFWHTLMHEVSHILHGEQMLDADIRKSASDTNEKRADEDAAEYLIPAHRLTDFVHRVGPYYSKESINRFANTLSIHPGVVVGQLFHRGEIKPEHNREMLVPVREILLQEAFSEGWGILFWRGRRGAQWRGRRSVSIDWVWWSAIVALDNLGRPVRKT